MAVKFNFASTDNYLTRLTDINDTLQALSKLSFTGTENGLPTGAIRLNSGKWQTWNGSTWSDITLANNISGNAGTVTNGVYTTGNQTIAGIKSFSDSIAVDTISEKTSANGVTVDGVKLKDGGGYFTGKVGIGTSTPSEKLHVSEGNLLNSGTHGASPVLSTSGAGTRMFFYPRKSAFRAGRVTGTQWDDVNIGNYSVAMGADTTAKGAVSIAMGYDTTASGETSVAMGRGSKAVGDYSFAVNLSATPGPDVPANTFQISDGNLINSGTHGTSPVLSVSGAGTRMFFYPRKSAFRAGYVSSTQWDDSNIGNYSVAIGNSTTASGLVSNAMGSSTTASGDVSTAMGYETTASGDYSTAIGYLTIASGDYSTAMGRGSRATGVYSFAINLNSSTGPDVPANTFRISGATAIGGNVAWTNYSDRRKKEDIRLLSSELDKINLLKPSRFKWKTVNEGVEKTDNLGLIAQEVREVYPEVVKGDEEKEILSLEYTGLIAPMIKAIQELTSRLEILEKKG